MITKLKKLFCIDFESGYRAGARAIFDYFHFRVVNNYHLDPIIDLECQSENDIVIAWVTDALEEIDPEDYNNWVEISKLQQEIAQLKGIIKQLENK